MKLNNKFLILVIVGCLAFAGIAAADHKPGHIAPGGGGSGEEDGGSSGGITPAVITFADTIGNRIASDGGGLYVHGEQGVEAFIGSKANYGNVWLRTHTSRALYVDFTDCASNNCTPPFPFANISPSSIKVDADDVIQNGIYGMSIGDSVHVPMRIYLGNPDWFVDFNPDVKAMKDCKNSTTVKVQRATQETWIITGDHNPVGCLTGNTGTKAIFLGNYFMPFEMTVQIK